MFKPIWVADLGCSINHTKNFDIIMNAKFVFFNFVLGERGLQPSSAMLLFASGLCAKILKQEPLK